MKDKLIIIAGPTAVGKTRCAVNIAKYFRTEIVSCDSMQIYREMSIGSAKPTEEEQDGVKHYLVDEIDPKENFSVAKYAKLSKRYIDDMINEGKIPIIAGGTGLYINSIIYDMDFSNSEKNDEIRNECKAILKEKGIAGLYEEWLRLDEDAAEKIHKNNVQRVIRAIERIKSSGGKLRDFNQSKTLRKEYEPIVVALIRDRDELYDRINLRVEQMMKCGLLKEVECLLKNGLKKEMISMKAIGYKELIEYLEGNISLDDAIDKIKQSSRRYAKRQLTWFRKYEKDGLDFRWFNLSYENEEDVIRWLREKL